MAEAADIARAYPQRSKHQLQRYAAGPDTLDWDAQPSPWRRFAAAPLNLVDMSLPDARVPMAQANFTGATALDMAANLECLSPLRGAARAAA